MEDNEAKDGGQIAPLSIRYEGGDAANHEIDLRLLGESLQGFAKCFAAAANFVLTGEPAQHFDAMAVRVFARPTAKHNCFEVWSVVKPIVESKELWSGAAGLVLSPIFSYIFGKRTAEEMKHLSDALQLSITGNQDTTAKLVATVQRLAEALNPSVRKALAPIDRTCDEIALYAGGDKVSSMDTETKNVFTARSSKVSDHSKIFKGVISEFDMQTGGCKVQLEGDDDRVSARVLDPVFSQPNNPYAEAMADVRAIRFLAKYELGEDGKLARLHILDTADDD